MGVRHDALVFSSEDELVDGTHDLIEQGLQAGDLVVVHGGDAGVGVLRRAWDDDPRITFADHARLYDRPMRTIGEFQRMLDHESAAGRRVRVTGPVPFGEEPRTRHAWMSYEALVDRALAPYEFVSLCQYDTRVLAADLLAHARATHDRVVTAAGVEVGGQRRAAVLAELAGADGPDPLESEPPAYDGVLTAAEDLPVLRDAFRTAPDDLVIAVNEIVTNALQHARPPVTVRLHRGPDRWLCVVTDDGPGLPDPFQGVDSPLPGNPDAGGHGLWVARQLCDDLTIASDPGRGGTTVRLVHRA